MRQKKWTRFFSYSAIAALLLGTAITLSACNSDTAVAGKIAEDFEIEITATQEDTEDLILDLQIPQVHGVENQDSINQTIQKDVDMYTKEVQEAAAVSIGGVQPDEKCSLYIRTTQYENPKEEYASILMECSNYTGGAHGMNWYKAYTISTKDGSIYTAGDLFQTPEEGIEQLRQAVLVKISESPDDGIFPSAEEYVKGLDTFQFYLCEGTLILWFDPYELAPYPAGVITLELPFEDLDGFLLK